MALNPFSFIPVNLTSASVKDQEKDAPEAEARARSRPRFAITPVTSLALVLLTLLLLVVVPMAIGSVADARERALTDEFVRVHQRADDVGHLLTEERNALNLYVISQEPEDLERFATAGRRIAVAFGRLGESAARLGGNYGDDARSALVQWQRWLDAYGLKKLTTLRGDTEDIRAAVHSSNREHQRVEDSVDSVKAQLDAGRGAVPARFRTLRVLQNTISVFLALLSLFAGFVVFRTQRYIHQNAIALESEREKLRAVYDGVDVGIALWEPRTKRLNVNPAGRSMLGLPEEGCEEEGQTLLEDLNPRGSDGEQVPREKWPLESASEGSRFEDCEIYLTRNSGEEIRILFSGGPVIVNTRGKVELAVAVFRDVTMQRAVETQLRTLSETNARRARELETIFAITKELSVQGGTERLHSYLTEQVARLFDAEKCVVWLCTPDGASLCPEPPAYGFSPEALETLCVPLGPESGALRVLEDDEPAINRVNGHGPDLGTGDESVKSLGLETILAVRLSASGKQLGILAVYNKRDRSSFTEEDARLLRAFAGQAAFALRSAHLYEEARRRAELLAWAMKETHHRIKNNLQAVSAILDVQAMDAGESVPAETLRDVLRQIRTIAVVHDLLSQNLRGTEEVSISAETAFEQLVPIITMGRADRRINTRLDVADILLPSKLATSLALAVNELASNAIKHGARGTEGVEVGVTLEQEEGHIRLTVCDNGPGFPPGFDIRKDAGIGLDLVRMLIERDLSGKLIISNAPGARVEAVIPQPGAARGAIDDNEHAGTARANL